TDDRTAAMAWDELEGLGRGHADPPPGLIPESWRCETLPYVPRVGQPPAKPREAPLEPAHPPPKPSPKIERHGGCAGCSFGAPGPRVSPLLLPLAIAGLSARRRRKPLHGSSSLAKR